MQIQSWALSRPDYNSTNLRSTRVRPPLLPRRITADYDLRRNVSTLTQPTLVLRPGVPALAGNVLVMCRKVEHLTGVNICPM